MGFLSHRFLRVISIFFGFFLAISTAAAVVPVLVSEGTGGNSGTAPGGGTPDSKDAALSDDGNWVAFTSRAQDLSSLSEDNGIAGNLDDVYLWNRATGIIQLVSVNDAGDNSGAGTSRQPAIDSTGSLVAYQSAATDILPTGDVTTIAAQVYYFDVATGVNKLATPNFDRSDGGNGESRNPSVSADGNYIVFESDARNLLNDSNLPANQNDDANGGSDIFLYDVASDTITLVSMKAGGPTDNTANSTSSKAKISADGNFVVFVSSANNLVSGIEDATDFDEDIFLYERSSGAITMISRNSSGDDGGNGQSDNPVINATGTVVAYESFATDLVAGISDGNGSRDVFAWTAGTNTLLSVDTTGTSAGNAISINPTISADGTKIAFDSQASDLTITDNNFTTQVYLRIFPIGDLSLVSLRSDGLEGGSGGSFSPDLSSDGNYIAFTTSADDLVAGTTFAGSTDVILRNLALNLNYLMSPKIDGTGEADGASGPAQVDAAGRFVVYESEATDLLAPGVDANDAIDLFLAEQPGLLQFSSDTYDAEESDGTVTITVNRVGGAGGEVSVDYTTQDDSAAQPGDYGLAADTLTWADGEMGSKTFDISIVDDDEFESNETVDLLLQNPVGGAALGDPAAAELTIDDDDENCTNDIDDNANSDVDCQDSDCSSLPSCQEICDDSTDNDDDNDVDCDDADCDADPACIQPEICNNLDDDDGDLLVDCADTDDCSADPSCVDPSGDGDSDGVTNGTDNCPEVSNAGQEDTDGDGNGNACDILENDCDNTVTDDTDALVDCADPDCALASNCVDGDSDGTPDISDNCPAVSNPGQQDTDNDGAGNACDTVEDDCDNGTSDDTDAAADCADSDCSAAANCIDDDGDGVPNVVDNCDAVANSGQEETDGDGVGNACDTTEGACNNGFNDDTDGDIDCLDSDCSADAACTNPAGDNDGDGVANGTDNCALVSNPGQQETDGDGIGNACDSVEGDCANGVSDDTDGDVDCADSDCSASNDCQDGDGDGEVNGVDNCPAVSNPGQEDTDGDDIGNACDAEENDCSNGVSDDSDADVDCADADCSADPACQPVPTPTPSPTPQPGDIDGDGVPDGEDNCPTVINPEQVDSDGNGIGDACEAIIEPPFHDDDGDGVDGSIDNCPSAANPDQIDTDDDGLGDACDALPTVPGVPPIAGGGCQLQAVQSGSPSPGGWSLLGLGLAGALFFSNLRRRRAI
ncbi:MAG TPA: Calx-beta domain-containing protein [bacterium]|nr:Calx-beta domain-containing protein [bacterium]